MSVIPITVFFSLGLVAFFVVLFFREQRRRFGSAERDSLLPLAEEQPRLQPASDHHPEHELGPRVAHAGPDHEPHGKEGCGCARGERPPCSGCLRHAAVRPAH